MEDRRLLTVVTPFTPRFSTNDTGEIMLVGNTLETASVTGNAGRTQNDVIDAQNGVGANTNNNNWNMAFVDVDGDPTTFNSSQATLSLPAGATVLFAGLYWGSVTTTAAQASARTQVLFSTPTSGGYTSLPGTLTGAANFTGQPPGSIYQGFADVTSLVAAAGSGTYAVGNVQATLESGSYAGWSLVVVARAPGDPARNLTVLDGFAVQQSTDPPLNIPVSGFITPPSGPVNSKVGVVAYEGDLGTTGDSMALNGVKLSDSVNQANNFFNSTISNEGQLLTAKNPNYRNQLGFGIKNVKVPAGVIKNGDTSATITLSTSGDGYFPGVVTFATDLFSPNVPVTKSYTDLNGGKIGPGDVVQYTVTLTNTGQDAANNLVFTDAIPANTTYVPGSLQVVSGANAGSKTDAAGDDQAEFIGNQVVFRLGTGANGTNGGTLAIGASATITFRVVVNSDTPNLTVISNQGTAAFRGATTGFNLSANSNEANYTVEAQADLQISKVVSDPSPNVGQAVTYTITLSNLGPDAATGVVITDVLPQDVSFAGATASQGVYDSTTGLWNVGTMANGAIAQLVIQAIVVNSVPGSNRATITSSSVPDPNPNNNTATSLVTPQTADLRLTKTVDDPAPNVGRNIAFTLTLTNLGPDTATNAVVSDPLPSGLTFQGAAPSQGAYDGASGLWSIGNLAPGATVTLTITARVDDEKGQINSAVASADQFDPNPADNSATAAETPQQADLEIRKSVNNSSPNVGDTVTFTITLTDLGPNAATGVTVLDLLPTGLMTPIATPSQGNYDSGTGVWTVGDLASGASATLIIQALVQSPAVETNTATVSGADQFDPNPNNNTSSAVVTPLSADLTLVKTVDNAPHNVGDTVTYTLTLTNNGPNGTTGAQVSDPMPAGVTFLSATPSQGSYDPGTGLWTVGTMANGAVATLTITARVDSPTNAVNTAVAGSDEFDPDPPGNTGTVQITPPQADLAVAKSVSDATPHVGDTITFTVQVVNNGPNNATGVTVADQLPDGLGFLSATSLQGTYDPGAGVWTVGDLSNGATATLTIQAIVYPPFQAVAGYPVTNFATVSADQFDPDESNNLASVTETPQEADLAITKSVSDATPNVGDTITYTVTLTNNGPTAATAVTVSDPLPAGLTFVSSSAGAAYDPGTGLWTVGAIANGASAVLTITATVAGPQARTNTATISHADQFDTNPANNAASVTETPQQADLAVAKTVDDSSPHVGDTVRFTVRLTNLGPSAATNVTVADTLPPGLRFVSAEPSQGTYDPATGIWTVGTVATSASPTLVIQAVATDPTAQTNVAAIAHSDQFDPGASNNTEGVTVAVQPNPSPPVKVDSLERFGFHHQPTQLVLKFSGPLDTASAQDLSNYRLTVIAHGGRLRRPLRLARVDYDSATNTVTITPKRRILPMQRFHYQLVVNATSPTGVADSQARLLDGDGDGAPGGDYVRVFAQDILAGPNRRTGLRGLSATGRLGRGHRLIPNSMDRANPAEFPRSEEMPRLIEFSARIKPTRRFCPARVFEICLEEARSADSA